MSRYATKRELEDMIRETIETDHNETGLPTDTRAYNMSGVMRDLKVMGNRHEGYTIEACGREDFVNALKRNRRTHGTGDRR